MELGFYYLAGLLQYSSRKICGGSYLLIDWRLVGG